MSKHKGWYENDKIYWTVLKRVKIMHDSGLCCTNGQFELRITSINTSRDAGLFYLHQHFEPNITFFSLKKSFIRCKQQERVLIVTTVRLLSKKENFPVQFSTNRPTELQDEQHNCLQIKWATAKGVVIIKILQRVDATGDKIWFFDKTSFWDNAHISSLPKTPQTSSRKIRVS